MQNKTVLTGQTREHTNTIVIFIYNEIYKRVNSMVQTYWHQIWPVRKESKVYELSKIKIYTKIIFKNSETENILKQNESKTNKLRNK
jgi:hypothetical protein